MANLSLTSLVVMHQYVAYSVVEIYEIVPYPRMDSFVIV